MARVLERVESISIMYDDDDSEILLALNKENIFIIQALLSTIRPVNDPRFLCQPRDIRAKAVVGDWLATLEGVEMDPVEMIDYHGPENTEDEESDSTDSNAAYEAEMRLQEKKNEFDKAYPPRRHRRSKTIG